MSSQRERQRQRYRERERQTRETETEETERERERETERERERRHDRDHTQRQHISEDLGKLSKLFFAKLLQAACQWGGGGTPLLVKIFPCVNTRLCSLSRGRGGGVSPLLVRALRQMTTKKYGRQSRRNF